MGPYWFAVKAEFRCPACGKLSTEVMYMNATQPDPDAIAAATEKQSLKCQHCKQVPANGTQIKITVLPTTLAEAKAAGFKPPPDMV